MKACSYLTISCTNSQFYSRMKMHTDISILILLWPYWYSTILIKLKKMTRIMQNHQKKIQCLLEKRSFYNITVIWGLRCWHTLVPGMLLLSHFSRVRLCVTPEMAAHQAPPSLGFSRQEHWSGLPFPSPMHESEKWKWSRSGFLLASYTVVSNS